MFSKLKFYQKLFLNYLSNVVNLLLMTYVEKMSYFKVAPPCHTMLTNTLMIYLRNKYVS